MLGVAAAIVLLAEPCAANVEKTDLRTLVLAFDEMALRQHGQVSKWRSTPTPLILKITAEFGANEKAILDAAFKVVEDHAKLKIVRDDAAEKPHFLVEFKGDLGSQAVGFHNIGTTNSTWGRIGAELRETRIAILKTWYRNDPYRIHRTLPHEVMHAVGFHGHPQTFDSVMSVNGIRYSLSEWDLFFLRVLYDPKLPVGTPRVFALPLVCTLMNERLIAEANTYVTDLKKDGPHPYCDELSRLPVDPKTPVAHLHLAYAYWSGLGVKHDLDEAERWARRALELKDPSAQAMLDAMAKGRQQQASAQAKKGGEPKDKAAPPPPAKVDFKPAAPGTTFTLDRGTLTIDKVEGFTIHTTNASNSPFRWAGMFFGRGAGLPVDPAEAAAAAIWPLEVGRTLAFEHANGTFKHEMKVLRTEQVAVGDRSLLTYVVERRVVRAVDQATPPYEGVFTFWYAPELGFPARYRSRFTGETQERPVSWTVAKIGEPVASR